MRGYIFPQLQNIKECVLNDIWTESNLVKMGEYAEKTAGTAIPTLRYSDFVMFYKTGNRKDYECCYYEHRKRLNYFAVLAALNEENNIYFKELENIVWTVLDEFTWALPAHISQNANVDECEKSIDLFAADTAVTLCEIFILFENRFDSLIANRLKFELRKRIIEPFINNNHSWENMTNNWSAVCGGCVGRVFLYMAREDEIEKVLPRLQEIMNTYLSGIGNDGVCVEGLDYWTFGFGHFCYFAEALNIYTKGSIDLFNNEKVHQIALFPQKICFKNKKCVNFSDCLDVFSYRKGMSELLENKFKDYIPQDVSTALNCDEDFCQSFSHLIRDIIYVNGKEDGERIFEKHTYYLKDAGWYIKKNAEYEFAVKAGNNNESHNHIDIGSFILRSQGEGIIIDSGKGEYTAEYFSQNRYNCFPATSTAHNIPVLNGKSQGIGNIYCGEIIKADEDEVILDLKNAYELSLTKFQRKFRFCDKEIIMTDVIGFTDNKGRITEHFVTEAEPQIINSGIKIGNSVLRIPFNYKCTVTPKEFSSGYDEKKTVYLIDIEVPDNMSEVCLIFRM